MSKLQLTQITLCAAASVNIAATIGALKRSLDQVDFATCLFFTDAAVKPDDDRIEVVPISRLNSAEFYSYFMLEQLAPHIRTDHVLVVQWDGFVVDAGAWDPEFLSFDYIGAPWPQFSDGRDVGNGGFSLRSRKLLDACLDPRFEAQHPEDIAICRLNRRLLEREHGIRFAPRPLADRFAFERARPRQPSFGVHGVFNMIPAIGADEFWDLYRSLDHPDPAFLDWSILARQLGSGSRRWARRAELVADVFGARLRRITGGGRRGSIPDS